MSFDQRTYPKTHKNEWDGGHCSLLFTSESSVVIDQPTYAGRALVECFLSDEHRFVHARPAPGATPIRGERDLAEPIHRKWLVDIPSLVSVDCSLPWRGMSIMLSSATHLPPDGRDFLSRKIIEEAREAVRKAIFLKHQTLSMLVEMNLFTEERLGEMTSDLANEGSDRAREDDVTNGLGSQGAEVVDDGSDYDYDFDDDEDDDYYDESDEEEEPRGASWEAIQRHVKFVILFGAPQTCMVCLEEADFGSRIGRMSCVHVFHEDCIRRWLLKSNGCPICRLKIPETDDYLQ